MQVSILCSLAIYAKYNMYMYGGLRGGSVVVQVCIHMHLRSSPHLAGRLLART